VSHEETAVGEKSPSIAILLEIFFVGVTVIDRFASPV
jgi:hypothetical protein